MYYIYTDNVRRSLYIVYAGMGVCVCGGMKQSFV